ncbi:proline-rich protein 23A3-like [Mesocricetus auratus]|uniref:Proline-rich protein 23A3-like n=1 Tax=Mesocricetus auratus TaxID=10036 RepID=A0ABM2WZT8_MESAU|nr:proline-rich protein 23A3-like [Mesocricetus auratus]
MVGARPRSPQDYLLQEEPQPAKRHCVRGPDCPRWLAEPDLEAGNSTTGKEVTSVVLVPAGFALKLHLEDMDLLLEPDPTSVKQVSLPGHTIILIPEGLQVLDEPGQPAVVPRSPQEAPLLDVSQEHQVVLQEEFLSASGSHMQGWGNASHPPEDPKEDFRMPWTHAPADMDTGPLGPYSQMYSPLFESQEPWPWDPSENPAADRYAPWSIWSLKDSTLWPLPSSPLQTLPPSPPSPPTSLRAQDPESHHKPPRSPCKARKRLFEETKDPFPDIQHLGHLLP